MTGSRNLPVPEAFLESMTEEDMAERRVWEGLHPFRFRGHCWERTGFGFCQPIHTLARLEAAEIGFPTPLCIGYRAALSPTSRASANGSLAVHLLANLTDYTFESLPAKRRTDLRKCRRLVQTMVLRESGPLLEQGYQVSISARARTGYHYGEYAQQCYAQYVKRVVSDPKHIVLAGFVGERLAGYLVGRAVNSVAYVKSLQIATEFLPTAVGTGLVFDFVQICRQSQTIREVLYGQHCPEDPGLGAFKEGMGFPVVIIPTRAYLPWFVRLLVKWRAPHKLYRLLGEPPVGTPPQLAAHAWRSE